jgi:hypothetical protein
VVTLAVLGRPAGGKGVAAKGKRKI